VIPVREVIKFSSNIGATKLAMQMQPREMHEMFTAIGLGQRPQISFPGAVTGKLRPYKTWRPIEQATMSYGYGLSASLFQLARAYTVFARDGEIIPSACCASRTTTGAGIRVFSPKTAGPAPDAAGRRRPRRHRAGPRCRLQRRRQDRHRAQAGRQGLCAPQVPRLVRRHRAHRKPRIIVAVMVDEPTGVYYGGAVAGPVFSQVVRRRCA
jgi:cell division protein FtsI (penicillin-binding protein 3)